MYMAFYSHGSWFDNLSDWIRDLAQKDPLSRAVNSLLNKVTGQGLTGAEQEANAFTAQQNREAMDFEERMAKNQMDFQAQQSATQWQRGVADMKAAGLNPALAYGQGGASAMSGSSGAGHAGASVAPNSGSSLSELIQLATLKPTIENMQAQARETRAKARAAEVEADWAQLHNENKYAKALEEVQVLIEQGNTMRYERQVLGPLKQTLMQAQAEASRGQGRLSSAEALYHEWRAKFYENNHYWPGERSSEYFWNLISSLVEGARTGPGGDIPAAGFHYP